MKEEESSPLANPILQLQFQIQPGLYFRLRNCGYFCHLFYTLHPKYCSTPISRRQFVKVCTRTPMRINWLPLSLPIYTAHFQLIFSWNTPRSQFSLIDEQTSVDLTWHSRHPDQPFPILELQNQSEYILGLHLIRRYPDFEAIKLWKGWSESGIDLIHSTCRSLKKNFNTLMGGF